MRNRKGHPDENLWELLLEDGEEFIEGAFRALLKRHPDASGGRAYLQALQNGTSKLQILHELSQSDECRRIGCDIPGLAGAFAQAGIGEAINVLSPTPPPEAAHVTRAEQLILINDNNKLIEVSYWVLLKRAPDTDGITNYLGKLNGGLSKTEFLHELFTSSECREIGVELPGLRDAFAREGLDVADEITPTLSELPPQPAISLAELIGFQGARFVECAYLTLLKREADIQGFKYRLAQLLGGTSKMQILSELMASEEAIFVGTNLPGLSAALKRYHLSLLPIFGKVVRLCLNVEGDSITERRGRIAEQRLLTLEAEIYEQFEHVEKKLIDFFMVEKKAIATSRDLAARILSLERSVLVLRQLIVQSARPVNVEKRSSSNAGEVKPADRLMLDLRTAEIERDIKKLS